MATATLSAPTAIVPETTPEPYRLSVDQYHRMIDSGIFGRNGQVKLVEGLLVIPMVKNPPHVIATGSTQDELVRRVPAGWYVSVQDPLTTDDSEPEPDLKIVRGARRDYAGRHPGPADLALVVEVADTSLAFDQGMMKRIYARGAVPVYWLLNLPDHRLEVYTDPTGPADHPDYRQRQDYGPEDEVPLVIDGREVGRIAVRDLLP